MLSLTRQADYAVIALVYLGRQWRVQAGPTSARQIAETFGLPLPVLMKTLKTLAHAQWLNSVRGASGGYELAVEPSRVSLLDVIAAVEKPDEEEASLEQDETGVDHPAVQRLHERINGLLGRMTLADLIDTADDETTLVSLGTTEARRCPP